MKANASKKRRKNCKKSHKKVNVKALPSPKAPARSSVLRNKLAFYFFRIFLPIVTVLSFVFGVVQCHHSSKSDEKNRELTIANKVLIEYNRELLENLITNKYEEDLKVKYPGGYALFGVDHSRTFKNESIPHRSNLLEQYEFDWRPVRINQITETTITITMPHIYYKPLDAKFINTSMIIPKLPKGKSWIYPPNIKEIKNRIFVEFIEHNDSFYVFAIGLKPE